MEHYSNVVKAMIARSNARAADIADKIQARAYYQFQYVPPAGPLPGWSMEQQTEDAINEIGNIAYSADEIAREAREIAQQAYNAAQAAIEMATNALTAAQNAQQTADTALNTANTAVTKADNAQASADAAQKAADAAQKSANDAQTSADNAQSTAGTAIENASQALLAANEAKASADHSNQRLDVLEPIVDTLRWYENVTDNIDFNTRVELERAFLQGTANTNGPVAGPGWLDVDDDYNETYIRHKFIAQADGACYVRFGTIVPDSSPIEVSSWTVWVKYALASELTSAVETINTSITSINGEITTIKGDITSIESDITELQGSLGSAEDDITAVTNALDAHKADYDNPHKVTAAQLGLATVYKYKGSVETYADLPTSGQQVGDVYNVKQADPDHNIEAGDNVAWDGEKWDILAGDTDLSGYAQLNSANTYTALNLFRANIGVSNGTAAGSSGTVSFGVSPTGETVQARIGTDKYGGLFYHVSTNQPHVFRNGSNLNSLVIRANDTNMVLSSGGVQFAIVNYVGNIRWLGNANTASKLETARTINGVPFDGTQNITIEAGQGEFLPLTGGTVTGPIYLPSTTPTTDTQAVTKKYVDDSVAGAGGGDVTAAGNNKFTGVNTFNNSTNFGSYIAVASGAGSTASGVINLGRMSGSNVQGASLSAVSTGQLNLTAGTGRNVVLQSRKKQTAVDLAEFSSDQATIYSNVLKVGANTASSVGIQRATSGEYTLQLVDNTTAVMQLNGTTQKATFQAVDVIFNDQQNTDLKIYNGEMPIIDCQSGVTGFLSGSGIPAVFGCGTDSDSWNVQAMNEYGDAMIKRRLYVGDTSGSSQSGVISAGNSENCLYFCGTAENTYYSTPNTGNTISYQAAANVYLINTSINDAASLKMNFSGMNFKATVGSVPYMCKTLTFWFVTGATAPTVTWKFPSGAAVYYPKGVAPALTANASNIINVVAIVDDTDSFSIQVCDVVALPYSG